MSPLAGWENFYVIVGSSAGALIGLQFVVITLIADTPAARADDQASGAFSTPSVVHFGVMLFLSPLVSAPWGWLTPVAVLWGLLGLLWYCLLPLAPSGCPSRGSLAIMNQSVVSVAQGQLESVLNPAAQRLWRQADSGIGAALSETLQHAPIPRPPLVG